MKKLHLITMANAIAVGKAETKYSDSVAFDKSTGEIAIRVVSTAGSITISQQCSLNNSDFFDPVSAAGAALGAAGSAITVTTGTWISFTPVFAPYMRFKIVEGNSAATAVTIEALIQKED